MRIYCAVKHSRDPTQYYGSLWSDNFYPALRALGHDIVESSIDLLPTSRFMEVADNFTAEELEVRAQTTQLILREVIEAHRVSPLGLFLSYFYNSHFDPTGFAELRRLGIPSVNFFCNSIYQFPNVAEISPHVDFAWHPERDARQLYLAVGANAVRVQMGADPTIYRPILGRHRTAGACFVGQRYADRERWLEALVNAGVDVSIFGGGWAATPSHVSAHHDNAPYLGRLQPLPGSARSYYRLVSRAFQRDGLGAFRRLLRQAAHRKQTQIALARLAGHLKGRAASVADAAASHEVFLNFSNVWADGQPGSALVSHVRLRDFEGPMCRTCFITGHTDEIEEFYEVGREIETYSAPAELIDKVRFYLRNPDASERLREAGYRRATNEHSWKHRFQQLFSTTGLTT